MTDEAGKNGERGADPHPAEGRTWPKLDRNGYAIATELQRILAKAPELIPGVIAVTGRDSQQWRAPQHRLP